MTQITETRKMRQFREREKLILTKAREMFRTDGYFAVQMARIAEAVEYATGTLYLHFSCKEDLLMALAADSGAEIQALLNRVAVWNLGTRERLSYMRIIMSRYVSKHRPSYVDIEQLAREKSIWEKASESRRNAVIASDEGCDAVIRQIIQQAKSSGDLNESVPETDILAAFHSFWSGTLRALGELDVNADDAEVLAADAVIRRAFDVYLDGLQWTGQHATSDRVSST